MKKEQEENEMKFYEILMENEACHRIIFEIKGSQIYQREIADKLAMVLRDLNERNKNGEGDWRDISELVKVNRKLKQALSAWSLTIKSIILQYLSISIYILCRIILKKVLSGLI